MGVVNNCNASPWEIAKARRKCVSAIGPKIMPINTGAMGKSKTRIKYPTKPIKNMVNKSNHELDKPQMPIMAKATMPAYR